MTQPGARIAGKTRGRGAPVAPGRAFRLPKWHTLVTIPLAAILALAGCSRAGGDREVAADVATTAADSPPPASVRPAPAEPAALEVTERVTGLAPPTSLLFLPDGSLLVSERAGGLRRIGRSGFVSTPLAGVPPVSDQGGLLDLALSPQFDSNGLLYFSYVEPREDGSAGIAVARATLEPLALLDVQVVYRQQPGLQAPVEAAGRLVFDGSGHLFIGSGERVPAPGIGPVGSAGGELLRIDASGKAPRDNPFAARGDGRAEVWSYGHGSIQGLAVDPRTGKLWLAENWSRGGDALNLPQAGFNYGPALLPSPPLPVETQTRAPAPVVEGPVQDLQAPGAPHHLWEEPQGLSGLAFYTGRPGAPWNDSLFLGSKTGRNLIRLSLVADRVVAEERLLGDLGQPIGGVRVDPGGEIFVLTDGADGKLLRITPPGTR